MEAATRKFAEVQSAYEVLSDPQERAWYDSHRHAIYAEDGSTQPQGQAPDTFRMTAQGIVSMIVKFDPRMEFSDSPTGFFGGLRDVFDQIAREEEIACRWQGIEPIDYPSFGSKDDSFEDVVRPFYAAWNGFSTRKTFAWKDIHKYSDAPDRRIRRLMEKENKRLREEGIREYNDAVRSLVAFVKKRDPRYRKNPQSEADRQRVLRESAAAQAARDRAANQAKAKMQEHVVPEWAKSQPEDEEEQYFFSSTESEEEEQFECVVCNKTFKSEKQFEAHERSKKHLKAVKQLRREMRQEDAELQLDREDDPEGGQHVVPDVVPDEVEEQEEVEEKADALPEFAKDENKDMGDHQDSVASATPSAEGENAPPADESTGTEDEDGDYDTREAVQARLSTTLHPSLGDSNGAGGSDEDTLKQPKQKVGKAKQRRAKKAARQAASEAARQTCAQCHATFPSRTQLFAHIREEGHAQPVPNTKQQGKQKKNRK